MTLCRRWAGVAEPAGIRRTHFYSIDGAFERYGQVWVRSNFAVGTEKSLPIKVNHMGR